MKLRQTEYCHNCGMHVEFEFEDVEGRQLILCPNCKHEHYREVDAATIVLVRTNVCCHAGGEVCFYDRNDFKPMRFSDGGITSQGFEPPRVRRERVVGLDENGCAIIGKKGPATVTDRRWGRDPRQ